MSALPQAEPAAVDVPEAPAPVDRPLDALLDTALHSYGQIVLARSRVAGLGLLAASFADPWIGLVGLVGVGLTTGLGAALGLDREAVRGGALGANGALVFLGLGAALGPGPGLWLAAPVAAAGIVLAWSALTGLLRAVQLPALSLPFVGVMWLLGAAVPALRTFPVASAEGPAAMALASLGALVFQPTALAGALVLAGLVAWSRVAAVHAAVGLLVATAFSTSGLSSGPVLGFNAAIVAIALGGVFYVPGPASLALAAGGALIASWGVAASSSLLAPVGLPTLALPLNLAILGALLALAQRVEARGPRPVTVPCPTPEETLHHDRTRVRRFARTVPVVLRLPFHGAWTCTQGHDGVHTHRGPWRHGLDFEIVDASGARHRADGRALEDWAAWRQPVLAMAAGTVVHAVDGVPDNAVGDVNLRENWGNAVVIQHAPDRFAVLAHLAQGSIRVVVGQTVSAGQVVGLCGNSGRSPAPHLHVQLQRSAQLGAPTVPIAFSGVVREPDGRLAIEGVPAEGEAWRNAGHAPALAEALAFPVGRRWTATVARDGQVHTERLVSEIDWLGRRSLVSLDRPGRLWFDAGPEGLLAYDVVGPRDGALVALYAALARAPSDEATELAWSDWVDPRRLGGGALAWVADALGAFLPTRPQRIAYRATWHGRTRVIEGQAARARPWQRPVRTRAVLVPGLGVVHVEARIGARRTDVSLEAT